MADTRALWATRKGANAAVLVPRYPRPPARSGLEGDRSRSRRDTRNRKRHQRMSRYHQRNRMNWKIGRLIQAYQRPARDSVRPEPVGLTNHVSPWRATLSAQRVWPTVKTNARRPSSRTTELRHRIVEEKLVQRTAQDERELLGIVRFGAISHGASQLISARFPADLGLRRFSVSQSGPP